uniref:Uncharacterized protein n=1 Tax=Anguilla anguilla TaxID=7936 RepID=A0A0E9XRV3_ANGAN
MSTLAQKKNYYINSAHIFTVFMLKGRQITY